MERTKLFGIFFLAVLCICFFSLPVNSGEYPWDNQEGGNGDGSGSTASDSTIVIGGPGVIPLRTASDPGTGSNDLLSFISFRINVWHYDDVYSKRNIRVNETKESAREYRGVYRSKKLID